MPKKMHLTRKQKQFSDYLLTHPKASATKAAKEAYNVSTNHSAEVIASENLRKPEILLYLGKHTQEAEETIVDIMQNSRVLKDEPAHAKIASDNAKDILNRVYGKQESPQLHLHKHLHNQRDKYSI